MSTTFVRSWLSPITGRVIRAATQSIGIGPLIYLAEKQGSSSAGDIETVTSAADAAALVTASKISAQAGADLAAAFGQSVAVPTTCYVVIYDPGAGTPQTLGDAMDYYVAAALSNFGMVAVETRTAADLEALGVWMGTGDRKLRWPRALQSADAGLLTASKPTSLDDCEVLGTAMLYHDDDTEPLGPGFAGAVAGYRLINGPMAMQIQIDGVALPTITAAELALLNANDGATTLQHDTGTTQSQDVVRGVDGYDGSSWKASLSLSYGIKLIEERLSAFTSRKAALGQPISADAPGIAGVRAEIVQALEPIRPVSLGGSGHLSAGVINEGTPDELALPRGYDVSVIASGGNLVATVTMKIGPEVYSVSLDVTTIVQAD